MLAKPGLSFWPHIQPKDDSQAGDFLELLEPRASGRSTSFSCYKLRSQDSKHLGNHGSRCTMSSDDTPILLVLWGLSQSTPLSSQFFLGRPRLQGAHPALHRTVCSLACCHYHEILIMFKEKMSIYLAVWRTELYGLLLGCLASW